MAAARLGLGIPGRSSRPGGRSCSTPFAESLPSGDAWSRSGDDSEERDSPPKRSWPCSAESAAGPASADRADSAVVFDSTGGACSAAAVDSAGVAVPGSGDATATGDAVATAAGSSPPSPPAGSGAVAFAAEALLARRGARFGAEGGADPPGSGDAPAATGAGSAVADDPAAGGSTAALATTGADATARVRRGERGAVAGAESSIAAADDEPFPSGATSAAGRTGDSAACDSVATISAGASVSAFFARDARGFGAVRLRGVASSSATTTSSTAKPFPSHSQS